LVFQRREDVNKNWEKICEDCGKCCGCVPLNPKKYEKYKHLSQRQHMLFSFDKKQLLRRT
jgi:uncharacterized cysteine cluster protein YcgN (CxxCxxCC family)